MKPRPYSKELRRALIGSLSRANMQEAGSRVSEIVIEKEADKLLALIKQEKIELLGRVMQKTPKRKGQHPYSDDKTNAFYSGWDEYADEIDQIITAEIKRLKK